MVITENHPKTRTDNPAKHTPRKLRSFNSRKTAIAHIIVTTKSIIPKTITITPFLQMNDVR